MQGLGRGFLRIGKVEVRSGGVGVGGRDDRGGGGDVDEDDVDEVDGDGEDESLGNEIEGEEVEDQRIYLRKGLMPRLVQILSRSSDSSLRLNAWLSALWAVKNSRNRTTRETNRDMIRDWGGVDSLSYCTTPTSRFKSRRTKGIRYHSESIIRRRWDGDGLPRC
ncbi:hypothetical protein DFP72DRAFT_1143891 [Ephemerocybe angulata]|uniref:Uncharacterized protein n=1 Tax=Ephemerocybe angulata TaxID=980116 RepID=A0A8H6HLT5_9AGAR|nr:hypothetical protein DFP72DRAFT_1143891 [Tulosesus angulatus]